MTRRLAVLLLPLLLVTVGCGGDGTPRSSGGGGPAPFADCAGLTDGPAATASTAPGAASAAPTAASRAAAVAGAPAEATGGVLPDLVMPCFTDGAEVRLNEVRGPAVINIWASWCGPCRKELPAFQRLTERSRGKLHVIGINSRDGRDAAQSIGTDFGLTFPTLVDQQEQLLRALARNALPLTLLVDARGRIRHLDASGALDDTALTDLVRRHLEVAP